MGNSLSRNQQQTSSGQETGSLSSSEEYEEFEIIRPVVVTGFGKIYPEDASDEDNFSWRVVEKLSNTIIDNQGRAVPVIKGKPSKEDNSGSPEPVKVCYSYVEDKSFQDWLNSTDALVYVHFGIKESLTNCVSLETTAKRNIKFTEDHFDHEQPDLGHTEMPIITTSFLDNDYLNTLCAKLRDRFKSGITMKSHSDKPIELSFKVSEDAGNFLCDYLYYESLDLASKRTNINTNFPRNVLFIHIPEELCRNDESMTVCSLDKLCETCESEKAEAFVDVIEFIIRDLLTQVDKNDTASNHDHAATIEH